VLACTFFGGSEVASQGCTIAEYVALAPQSVSKPNRIDDSAGEDPNDNFPSIKAPDFRLAEVTRLDNSNNLSDFF
jgi:hypothetical protein